MVESLVLFLRSNILKRYVQARILDTASLYKASDGSPKAPRRPRRLAAAFPEASHPLLHREARKGSPEARKGGGLPEPKNAFCQPKVFVQIDALWPAAVFRFSELAWPLSCMPPYGTLYGETANGSLKTTVPIRRPPVVVW